MSSQTSEFRFSSVGSCKQPNCPAKKKLPFTARTGGGDNFRAYRSTSPGSNGRWFAACPDCHSHQEVEKLS